MQYLDIMAGTLKTLLNPPSSVDTAFAYQLNELATTVGNVLEISGNYEGSEVANYTFYLKVIQNLMSASGVSKKYPNEYKDLETSISNLLSSCDPKSYSINTFETNEQDFLTKVNDLVDKILP